VTTTTTIRSSLTAYGVSLAAVAVAVAARLLLEPLLADRLPFITLFLVVGFAAWYGGRGPGLLALVAGAVAAAFFLTQPLSVSRRFPYINLHSTPAERKTGDSPEGQMNINTVWGGA